jgi:small subunit ribosomal protein S20
VPRIKSAIKRVEVAERNRLRNKAWKSAIRTATNHVEKAVAGKDEKQAQELLKAAYKVIDKAVSKGILNRNTAARKKSSIAKEVLATSKK